MNGVSIFNYHKMLSFVWKVEETGQGALLLISIPSAPTRSQPEGYNVGVLHILRLFPRFWL